MKNWRSQAKYAPLLALGLLAAALLPVDARHVPSWRADGSAGYATTAGTQATNTGFNPFERFLNPASPDFGRFWRSFDIGEYDAGLAGADPNPWLPRVWPPVVIELLESDEIDVFWDHLIIVPRGTELAAYYPHTNDGLNAVLAANFEISPALNTGWTFDLEAELGEVPLGSAGIAAPVIATRQEVVTGAGTEIWHMLYVLTGSGTAADPSRVLCLRLDLLTPQGLPVDPEDDVQPELLWATPAIVGTDPALFTRVQALVFADIGDVTAPEPRLFLTTEDGQVIAFHAAPGAPWEIDPNLEHEQWRWEMPTPPAEAFSFGALPAVARVRLAAPFLPQETIDDALANGFSEWLVFVAGNDGVVRALDAFGDGAGDPQEHWAAELTPPVPDDPAPDPDRFAVGPLLWNPATPLRTTQGILVSGSRDVGYDDVLVVAGESGFVYGLAAQGDFDVDGNSLGTTQWRWTYPDNLAANGVERAPWPVIDEAEDLEDELVSGRWTIRSPLAATAGVNADPDSAEPNNLISDDRIYVRYDEVLDEVDVDGVPHQEFYEWIGSLNPYGFVELAEALQLHQGPPPPSLPTQQTSEPPLQPVDPDNPASPVLITVVGQIDAGGVLQPLDPADQFAVPFEFIRVGRARADGAIRALYLTNQTWMEEGGTIRTVQFGDELEFTYLNAAGDEVTETRLFPSRQVNVADPEDPPDMQEQRTSLGRRAVRIQGDTVDPLAIPKAVFDTGLRPAMSVTPGGAGAGVIFVGTHWAGRIATFNFLLAPLNLIGHAAPDPADPPDPLVLYHPTLGLALTDGWAYVTYANGHLVAFGNNIGSGGTIIITDPADRPPFFEEGIEEVPGTQAPMPEIRVVHPLVPVDPTWEADDWLDENNFAISQEPDLLYDWGEQVFVRAVFDLPAGADAETQNIRELLVTTPLSVVLRGPVGAPITVTAQAAESSDPDVWVALAVLTIPNASPSNPMSPGTRLLGQTDQAERAQEPHWRLEATQSGVQWVDNFDDPDPTNRVVRRWVPRPDVVPDGGPWSPDPTLDPEHDAPWISLNNPLALFYNPADPAGDLTDPQGFGVALLERFTDPDHPERFNGDEYLGPAPPPALPDREIPRVVTVGTLPDPDTGQPLRQILFAGHGEQSPVSMPPTPEDPGPFGDGFPAAGVLRVIDRSDLAFRGEALRVRFQRSQLVKLGVGAALGDAEIAPGAPAGSYQQNMGLLDNGPDGFYPAISAQNLFITRVGSGEDASAAAVPIRGVGGDEALKLLQPEGFHVRVDVPRYQPDDLYAARWRDTGPQGSPPGSEIDPFALPYADSAENDSGDEDDRRQRLIVFVDANNNGRLDLQGNFREAYRTVGFQIAIEPEQKLEVSERVVDLGSPWHGKADPTDSDGAEITGFHGRAFLDSIDSSDPVRAYYERFWERLTLLNTGNVNLGQIKPDLFHVEVDGPVRARALPGRGLDPYRAFPLVRGGPDELADPRRVHLRTSVDDVLTGDFSVPYNLGSGAWLQKARAGAGSPGAVLYSRDPTDDGTARELGVSLNVPTGTPLGTYEGLLRFFNDRSVTFTRDESAPFGYRYGVPLDGDGEGSGALELLDNQPVEPVTEPALTLRMRVTEAPVAGRRDGPPGGGTFFDPAVRRSPAVAALPGPGGLIGGILMAYNSREPGPADPLWTQVLGTRHRLDLDTGNLFFNLDPARVFPWAQVGGDTEGFDTLSDPAAPAHVASVRPSLAQADGRIYAAWLERASAATSNQYWIGYRQVWEGGGAAPGPIHVARPGGTAPDLATLRSAPRLLGIPNNGTPWWALFSITGQGARRSLVYTATDDPETPESWSPEHLLAVPTGLASIEDPRAVLDPVTGATWVFFSGYSERLGRTDVYALRYDTAALLTAAQRGVPDPLGPRAEENPLGQLRFARVVGEELRANSLRTHYHGGGADWRVLPFAVGGPDFMLELSLEREDSGGPPVPLLRGDEFGTPAANGDLVYEFSTRGDLPLALQRQLRVIVDPASGAVRFNMDTRAIARILLFPELLPDDVTPAPDPVIRASYTPLARRMTPGDFPASAAAAVFTRAADASWFRQTITEAPVHVPGQADRLWLFWRREGGAEGGGPNLAYRVYRPGVQVGSQPLTDITRFTISANGTDLTPEEVDVERASFYFAAEPPELAGDPEPFAEGTRVTVELFPAGGGDPVAFERVIGWIPETQVNTVPMATSVNEGGVDVFATYEIVEMAGGPVEHLEKLWLFWDSAREPGLTPEQTTAPGAKDMFYATIAPRIGPRVDYVVDGVSLEGLLPPIVTEGPLKSPW